MSHSDISYYFTKAIDKKASDLYLIADQKPIVRVNGAIDELDEDIIANHHLIDLIHDSISEERWTLFEEKRDMDFAHQVNGHRLRINLHWQQGKIALAARIIPKEIPKPEDLLFSDIMYELTSLNTGLILVTGPSGAGKSTTLASMIDIINAKFRRHIITLEDPIEFVYTQKQSIIEQREVGLDTKTFYSGLKYALRQDPDVILVGEMRDRETMSAALTAAETGHLVLSTLHTNSAAETIDRIVDIFDSERRHQILVQLSATLKAVISQELLPSKGGGILALRETLLTNHAVANLIRQNKIAQIPTVIQTSRKLGMLTKLMALKELYKDGYIDKEIYDARSEQEHIVNE